MDLGFEDLATMAEELLQTAVVDGPGQVTHEDLVRCLCTTSVCHLPPRPLALAGE
jgi:hypothetical protein